MTKEELIIGFFEKGWCCDLDEVKNTCLGLLKENQKYKEVIDKARTKSIYLQEQYNYILDDLIFLLKEVE